jgi:hypothetical protein
MNLSNVHEGERTPTRLSEKDVSEIREQLAEILEGPTFRGAQRCGQFLRYVVENALSSEYEMLKERTIGSELFGRDPSYETKVDAIVRVTASEVRKRLEQYYQNYGKTAKLRIRIPSGTYSPVFLHASSIKRWVTRIRVSRIWLAVLLGAVTVAAARIVAIPIFHAKPKSVSALPWTVFFQSPPSVRSNHQ